MSITYYMMYSIIIQDDATYQAAYALSNNSGFLAMTPRAAAQALGIPFPYPSGPTNQLTKYIVFYPPYTPGTQIGFPNPSGVFVDDTILSVTVPAQAGVPASIWPADPTKNGIFTWSGIVVKSEAAGSAVNPPPGLSSIPRRLAIGGGEMHGSSSVAYEGGNFGQPSLFSRAASRTPEGFGLAIRGSASATSWSRNPAIFRALASQDRMHDRFYFRVNKLPSTQNIGLWRSHSNLSAGVGGTLKVMTDGSVQQFSSDAGSVETLQATIINPVVLGQWYKIDVIIRTTNTASDRGNVNVYVNGLLMGVGFTGIGGPTFQATELGKYNSVTENEVEIDLDDWITTDWSSNFTVAGIIPNIVIQDSQAYPIDWLTGTHIRNHRSTSVSQTNWNPANGAKVINSEGDSEQRPGTTELTSTTSGAILEGLTDVPNMNTTLALEAAIGVASVEVGMLSKSSAVVATGQLGYKIAGVGPTTVAINETTADIVNTSAYQPTLGNQPNEVNPVSVDHIKSTDINTNTVTFLQAVAEYIGIWGPEDDSSGSFKFTGNRNNIHNCRYFGSTYFGIGSKPIAPCYAVGGTYTGNGAYQEVTLPAPAHFLKIRPTITAISGGVNLFGASNGPHNGIVGAVIPNIRLFYDTTGAIYKFAVWGAAGSLVNVNAEVYQYIAFCDPGMRFNLCGAFLHGNSSSTPKVNTLVDSTFLADCGFAQAESYSVSSSLALWLRGPANTGLNSATALDGSAVETNFGNFSIGAFNSLAKLHSGNGDPNTNYSLWRKVDSGIDASSVMVQILSYTGNGLATQNVTLTPTSNRFPLFVAVFPNTNAASFYRDPSHTATNSCTWTSTANSTTGITAVAKDQITVGTSLNVNGVTYTIFAICGDTTGMNNGTFAANYNAGATANYVAPQFNNGVIVVGNGGLVLDGIASLSILKNISGIYQMIVGKRVDTYQDTQTGQTSVDTAIPNPTYKTGYIGG